MRPSWWGTVWRESSGRCITVLGTVLPPLVILSVISFFYAAFRDNQIVSMAMAGMAGRSGRGHLRRRLYHGGRGPAGLRRVLPVCSSCWGRLWRRCLFGVNVVVIILVCGVIGALDTIHLARREHRKEGALT